MAMLGWNKLKTIGNVKVDEPFGNQQASYTNLSMKGVKGELGALHSAKNNFVDSVDFDEIEKLQHPGQWARKQRPILSTRQNL